ncbi:MAG: restriction endonuclease subunit S [Prolixibacteraceae bacterium]|nr:restriction endonuclease subunit S [Prolixibacteraceae bacterium]
MKNVKLGVICNIEIGRTPSRNQPKYWGNGYSWLSIADMKNLKFLSDTKEQVTDLAIEECNMKLVPQGTLLFSFKLSVGKVGIASKDLFTNEAIAALKIKSEKEVYQPFLYHALGSLNFDGKGDRAVKGITLNKAKLRELLIPLPPLPEQKRIAEILDKADALHQKNKQLLYAYDELLQATFLDMFGDPVTNPKGWEKSKISNLINNIDSGWSPNCNSIPRKNSFDWAILTLSSVSQRNYKESFNKNLPQELNPKDSIEVKKGDLLFSRKNTRELVGACAFVFETSPRLMMPDTIFRIQYKSEILNGIYAFYLLNSINFRVNIQRLATGSAGSMPNISKEKLKNLFIPLPPITLQNQFAQIVENIEAQKTLVKQSLQESEDLFNGLVQKAFSGEL